MDETSRAGSLGGMDKKKKVLFGLLIVLLVGLVGYRLLSQGFFSEQGRIRSELQKIESDIAGTKAKFPDIKAQEKELEDLQRNYEEITKEIASYEAKIPAAGSVSRLLGEITRRAEGLNMDFESIRQSIEREKEGYLKLEIEMKFAGPYSGVVNYLNRLQDLSDYLTVPNIEISQTKEGAPRSKTNMQLSMLLLEKGVDLKIQDKESAPAPLVIKLDPFTSKKVEKKDRTKDFKLSGITMAGGDSTAIVNDEVVRVGTMIGEWKVVKISSDAITLSDGVETVSVTLNR